MDHLLLDKAVDSFIIKPSEQSSYGQFSAAAAAKTSYLKANG
jgi:hypothetical protein